METSEERDKMAATREILHHLAGMKGAIAVVAGEEERIGGNRWSS